LSIPPYIWYDVINNYRSTVFHKVNKIFVMMVLRVRTGRCALLEGEVTHDDRAKRNPTVSNRTAHPLQVVR